MRHKDSEQVMTFNRFIDKAASQIEEQVAKLGIDAPKLKAIVSDNILSGYLNTSLEADMQQLVLNFFINKQLHHVLVQEGDFIVTAEQFIAKFSEVFKV